MTMRLFTHTTVAAALLALAACTPSGDEPGPAATEPASEAETRPADTAERNGFAAVDRERLVNADAEPEQWMTYGGNYEEQRFSRLDQINTDNIDELSLAWFADFDTNLTQQGTPLAIDGVVYTSTAWSKVYAFDAVTGEELWQFDPEVPGEHASLGCCSVVNRGIAAWNGKIFVGAYDGRLIAIDAETGEQVWSTMTVDHDWYSITGAPRAFNGLVIIGNGGAELGVRGFVTAYDAETGEKVWRFYLVPGNPDDGPDGEVSDRILEELALPTWTGEFWALGGGGTAWDSIIYDPELNQVLIGGGNGSPWNASMRSPEGGDNLFLTSIVAVDADTGEYRWHYQQNPWETWDYTATMPLMIANLDFDGQTRRVVMQAPKNGFFYVLDAHTGEFISAENFVDVNWAEGIDPETGRPIEIPDARYDVTGEPFILQPGPQGAHSWHPMSFSPDTGLVYFAAQETSLPYIAAEGLSIGIFNLGVDFVGGNHLYEGRDDVRPGIHKELVAWDPVNQREAWRHEIGGSGSGTLATAGGLVFSGNSINQEFVAYRATDGERLWSAPTQTGLVAGPISYAANGEQYIAQVVGVAGGGGYYSSNHSRLLVWKLGGTAELPPPTPPVELVLDPPPTTASEEALAQGRTAYANACAMCHGDGGADFRGHFPDLRYSPALWDQTLFDLIVLDGQRSGNGMPGFADTVTREESEAIRHHIIDLANRLAEQRQGQGQGPGQGAEAPETDE